MLRDLTILSGIACVIFGAWQVYPPLAWILGGALVSAFGIVRLVNDERNKRGRSG